MGQDRSKHIWEVLYYLVRKGGYSAEDDCNAICCVPALPASPGWSKSSKKHGNSTGRCIQEGPPVSVIDGARQAVWLGNFKLQET